MPSCKVWPCPNWAVKNGVCAEHMASIDRPKRKRSGAKADLRYGRMKWANTRRLVLAQEPICQDCGHAASVDVHHVVPVGAATDDVEFYTYWPRDDGTPRMLALCKRCHGRQDARSNW